MMKNDKNKLSTISITHNTKYKYKAEQQISFEFFPRHRRMPITLDGVIRNSLLNLSYRDH